MIYADHAATTRLDPIAFEAMKPYLLDNYGNASQPYSFSRDVRRALQKAREDIAVCIGAEPEEIFFTSGGTESDNWALKGTMLSAEKGQGLAVSEIEHHAVLRSAESLRRMGYIRTLIPVDREGTVSPENLRKCLNADTRLVSVMLANNEIGTVEPIKELVEEAHAAGAIFHTDAVQAVGHIPVDVKTLGVDLLSASAHKFNGPKGVGFLYIRKGTKVLSYLDGGAQEKGLRAGTENVAGIVGMATALKNSTAEMEDRMIHLFNLERILIERLNQMDVRFIRNGGHNHLPGLISLSFKGEDGEALLHRLDLMGICVSTGSACDSTQKRLSHVIQAIQVPEEYAYGTIRITLGNENKGEDIGYIEKALRKIICVNVNKM